MLINLYRVLVRVLAVLRSEANSVCLNDLKQRRFLQFHARDLDNRGLHFGLRQTPTAYDRLDFCLEVYARGGSFVHIDNDRAYIDVSKTYSLNKCLDDATWLLDPATRQQVLGTTFFTLAAHLGYDADPLAFDILERKNISVDGAFFEGFTNQCQSYCDSITRRVGRPDFTADQIRRRDDFIRMLLEYSRSQQSRLVA